MRQLDVTVSKDIPDLAFPVINAEIDLHNLEGTLWLNLNGEVHLLCQVAPHQWAMILIDEGNRNVDIFTFSNIPYDQLNNYTRFYGTVTLRTK